MCGLSKTHLFTFINIFHKHIKIGRETAGKCGGRRTSGVTSQYGKTCRPNGSLHLDSIDDVAGTADSVGRMNFRGTFFPDMSCRNVAPWQKGTIVSMCVRTQATRRDWLMVLRTQATRRDWLMVLHKIGSLLQPIRKKKQGAANAVQGRWAFAHSLCTYRGQHWLRTLFVGRHDDSARLEQVDRRHPGGGGLHPIAPAHPRSHPHPLPRRRVVSVPGLRRAAWAPRQRGMVMAWHVFGSIKHQSTAGSLPLPPQT
jgi:hypothetical protein